MRKIPFPSISFFLIFLLSLSVSFLLLQVLQLKEAAVHKSSIETAKDNVGTYRRLIVLENVDLERSLIGAKVTGREIMGVEHILFSFDEETFFGWQEPQIQNGTVVNFTEVRKINPSDFFPGTEGFATIVVREDGTLYARTLLGGSPFVRP